MNEETMTTDELLRQRLTEVETKIKIETELRDDHLREAKAITDELPAIRLERNRLRRALGLPCKSIAQETAA